MKKIVAYSILIIGTIIFLLYKFVLPENFFESIPLFRDLAHNYIAVWIAFGLTGGVIAVTSGRGFIIWTIATMFFPPLVLYLIFAKNYKKCPDCGETIYEEAKICRYCRKTFS